MQSSPKLSAFAYSSIVFVGSLYQLGLGNFRMAVPLEDCCGLGCNNCILDRFIDSSARLPSSDSKIFNLFNQTSYQNFKVKEIKKDCRLVYQFTFELTCDRDEPYQKDEQLLAPPVSYLMLRARRDFPAEYNEIFSDFKELLDDDDDDNRKVHKSQPQRHDKSTPEIYFSRKFTPFEVNEQLRTFKIKVKLEPFGKMSRFLTTLRVGTVCEFKGPFEAFNYVHEAIENYIVVTQGKCTGYCNTIFKLSYQFLMIFRNFGRFKFSSRQRNYLRKCSNSNPRRFMLQKHQRNFPSWRFLQAIQILEHQTSHLSVAERWSGNSPKVRRENSQRTTW